MEKTHKHKKKRRHHSSSSAHQTSSKQCKQTPLSTLSIAIPGSLLSKVQSAELRTYVAGCVARAAAVFNVTEVVVYDDLALTQKKGKFIGGQSMEQLITILQYLECPQYLRKAIFPLQENLKFAGLLNPLDCPHHLRAHESSPYRDGLVLERTGDDG